MPARTRGDQRARRIQSAQRREIQRLLRDPAFVRAAAGDPAYARVGEWLTPPGRTVEIGCGPGRFVALLAGLGHEVVGIDVVEFPDWELLRPLPDVHVESGISAEALPFEDNSFDHASCISALLYFSEPTIALAEIARVLRPGGRLVVRTVNSGNLYTRRTKRPLDPASRNLFTLDELTQLVQRSGFTVDDRFAYGFWPPMATDLWWYLQSTRVPLPAQRWLSRLLPASLRVNNVVLAST